jgi:hypothetical protein
MRYQSLTTKTKETEALMNYCRGIGAWTFLSTFYLDGYRTPHRNLLTVLKFECIDLVPVRYSVTDTDHFSIYLDPCIDSNPELILTVRQCLKVVIIVVLCNKILFVVFQHTVSNFLNTTGEAETGGDASRTRRSG